MIPHLSLLAFLLSPMLAFAQVVISEGIALHGRPALAKGFAHLPYVNPDAPKGGSLRQSAIGTFDSLNAFINKGVPAEGLNLLYDTLTAASEDEPFSRYGLLAEHVERDPADASWVIYQLRPEARFADGHPLRARDVVFTFDVIRRLGAPAYKAYYADVSRVEALTPLRVRFQFRRADNRELALTVGDLPILPEHAWRHRRFDETTLKPPLGSGPYRIATLDAGRRIVYRRDPSYWGRDLPVNRGRHNLDEISYQYYRDGTVAFEGFKAGQYDLRLENKAKTWATEYNFPAIRDGRIVRFEQPHQNPAGMQGFVFNTRRPLLQDVRVREALALAFDFEWSNRALFHQAYRRTRSFFDNSPLAASGLPSAAERRLLAPFRPDLQASVFGEAVLPPVSDGSGFNRPALVRAQQLLKSAGWSWWDGALRRADGVPMKLEILLAQPEFERIVQPWKRNLARLGIQLDIRILDVAQYVERLRQFDFDSTVSGFPASSSPGNELADYWGSAAATQPGSRNLSGLRSPAVDSLIASITRAGTRESLVTGVHALDRVLRSEWLLVPHYHTPVFRIAARDQYGRPARPPRHGDGIDTWWWDAAKARHLSSLEQTP